MNLLAQKVYTSYGVRDNPANPPGSSLRVLQSVAEYQSAYRPTVCAMHRRLPR